MTDNKEQTVSQALKHLATQPTAHHPPPAAQLWSQVQFRLHYRERATRVNDAGTAVCAAVAVCALALLLWNIQLGLLILAAPMLVTIAAVVAILLSLRISRTIRS
jgi:hypothetical protein